MGTLSVYLFNNGNSKILSISLFKHCSALRYRMERIHGIPDMVLEDAENTIESDDC
ncbi:PucR C-terminal helix-turn-helix domain-containing protein [Bacillus sp. OK838]|nr:PucR C-terminal helix-turn-helix domain-containing protein [Bacillus sp. OK838]